MSLQAFYPPCPDVYVVFSFVAIFYDARVGGAHLWHQDFGYWCNNGCVFPNMGTAFIPIDKMDAENAGLKVLKGGISPLPDPPRDEIEADGFFNDLEIIRNSERFAILGSDEL